MTARLPWIVFLLLGFGPVSFAQEAADFFAQKCKVCHTIGGGRRAGPDLKDVTQQRDRAWLENFIQNPRAIIDSGVPFRKIPTADGGTAFVVTVYDLLMAQYGVARNLPGEYPKDYDAAGSPSTPVWSEQSAGIGSLSTPQRGM